MNINARLPPPMPIMIIPCDEEERRQEQDNSSFDVKLGPEIERAHLVDDTAQALLALKDKGCQTSRQQKEAGSLDETIDQTKTQGTKNTVSLPRFPKSTASPSSSMILRAGAPLQPLCHPGVLWPSLPFSSRARAVSFEGRQDNHQSLLAPYINDSLDREPCSKKRKRSDSEVGANTVGISRVVDTKNIYDSFHDRSTRKLIQERLVGQTIIQRQLAIANLSPLTMPKSRQALPRNKSQHVIKTTNVAVRLNPVAGSQPTSGFIGKPLQPAPYLPRLQPGQKVATI